MKKNLFSSKPNLFSIGMITFLDQVVSEPQIQFHPEPWVVVLDETLTMEKVKNFIIAKWALS
jgi:hypothetical protein